MSIRPIKLSSKTTTIPRIIPGDFYYLCTRRPLPPVSNNCGTFGGTTSNKKQYLLGFFEPAKYQLIEMQYFNFKNRSFSAKQKKSDFFCFYPFRSIISQASDGYFQQLWYFFCSILPVGVALPPLLSKNHPFGWLFSYYLLLPKECIFQLVKACTII